MNEASTSWKNGFAGISAVFIKEIFTTCLGSASVSSDLAALVRENMCPKKTQASEPGSQNRSLGRGWGKKGASDAHARALTSARPDPGMNKTSVVLVKIILLKVKNPVIVLWLPQQKKRVWNVASFVPFWSREVER